MERSRKESDRAKYLRPNPVDPEKKDLVLPQSELIAKMIIAFSGLLFMVRLSLQAICYREGQLVFLHTACTSTP